MYYSHTVMLTVICHHFVNGFHTLMPLPFSTCLITLSFELSLETAVYLGDVWWLQPILLYSK